MTRNYLDLLAWNAWKGNHPTTVLRALDVWLRRYRPDVVVVNEAIRFSQALELLAVRHGYALVQEEPVPDGQNVSEHGDTAIMVKESPDLRLVRHWTVGMALTWLVFSHRRRHQPRRYPTVILRGHGGRWRITGGHWETAGNSAAQEGSRAWTERWMAHVPRRTVGITVGDLNTHVPALQRWAKKLHAIVRGRNVDAIVAVNAGAVVLAEELGKGGGDHAALLYRVTR